MSFAKTYLRETAQVLGELDFEVIERCIDELVAVRERHGRVFVLGNGGSAANASHMVNDLRKIASIEAYAPTDNVAELTARTNDDGWHTTFARWLEVSHANVHDLILVLSVNGGYATLSPNLTNALGCAASRQIPILGIVGESGGYTAQVAKEWIKVPSVAIDRVTPHAEEAQSIVCHLFVSHPKLRRDQ